MVRIKCGNTRGLCLMATGDMAAAEREFRAALQFAEEQGNEHYVRLIAHNLGLPAAFRGDFGEALRWSRRMLRETQDLPPMPQEATAHLNIARFNFYRGELEECEQHLDRALEICQLFNLIALRAETFETYGNLYRERGDAVRATEFYERAARAYDEAGVESDAHRAARRTGHTSSADGQCAGRARATRQARRRARAGRRQDALSHGGLARGRVIYAQGDGEAARADLEPARSFFHSHGLYWFEVQACLALAFCDLAASREQEMLEHLRRTLDLMARYDYEYWLKRELQRNPVLLANGDAAELLPADVREQTLSAPPPPPVTQPAEEVGLQSKPVTDLTINMLGPIEIFRDPLRPLSADAWTTKRARDILCFIASRRHRRASKDTIIDTFWGEADFDVVEKNFHPTVSHIRKALNSNQPLKQKFLLYRDGDYLLNPEFSYRIDTEEFDRLVTEAEAARRAREFERCIGAYEQAIALYRGDFMQGSYDEWVDEQRSYYQEQHLRMLESLAAVAQKMQEWPRSLDLAHRILHADPFREDIHCMIMRAHAALGNRVAVKEQYESLSRLLRKELGVEPAHRYAENLSGIDRLKRKRP